MPTRIGIVGGSGYTSSELMRLLVQHSSNFELALVTSETYSGYRVDQILPNLKGFVDLSFEKLDMNQLKNETDVVVLGVPHKVAMSLVPDISDQGLRIVDFSADYRLREEEVYNKWYQTNHTDTFRLSHSVYGLPERYRESIRSAQLVANPGCYPTGAILALAPLVKEHIVDKTTIIIDSKSGISGAGSKPKDITHYSNRESNTVTYGLPAHRHTPEIEQELRVISGADIVVTFAPHLVPMTRGILTTAYAELTSPMTTTSLLKRYQMAYQSEPFVRVLNEGEYPQTKSVLGSNFCHIGLVVDPRTQRVIVMSAIDNMMKGAAGAVVQNLNLMYGLNEKTGLMYPGMMP